MRTFEAVLILVNVFSLFLVFKKQSKAVRLGTAGVHLSVLLLHGVFEGFRYQMAFAYLFVILLTVFALIKANDRFHKTKTQKGLKVATAGMSFTLFMLTSFLAYALPVFALPKPTGTYDVGIKYVHLIDKSRTDPFLDTSTKNRELMVKVYYPAQQDAKTDDRKSVSRYFHNSHGLIRSFTAFYSMPDFVFDHLLLVRTNSKEGLQLSEQQQNYPVVLFSHGAGTSMEVQTSQSEDLASHGYIVAAIDHTYVSAATVFPDRIVSAREATTDFNTVEPAEIITQIMADDAAFVMEQLSEMNDGKFVSLFEGKLDLEKIGIIGHSVGGAVAYNQAINDSRVKAAINLDGRVYITPEDPKNMAAFLMLASDKYHVQTLQDRQSLLKNFEDMTSEEKKNILFMYGSQEAYDEAYNKDFQNVVGLTDVLDISGNLFTIEGSDHMKFTDIGLFIGASQLRELIGIGGKTDPVKCLAITKSLTVAFFDQHLKGENKVTLESLLKKYPSLKRIDLQ